MGVDGQERPGRSVPKVQSLLGPSWISKTGKKTLNKQIVLRQLDQDCQTSASNGWSIQHIDLKTAFLQGETYAPDRDVVCQLPPKAGKLWYLAARLKKPACGMNDAPRINKFWAAKWPNIKEPQVPGGGGGQIW